MSTASRGLAAGAVGLLGAALCHRFVVSTPAALAALLLVTPIALALGTSWLGRPTTQALATAIDRGFGTHSLIAAAWSTRSDALTPAARIVRVDANARAAELHAQLATLWPIELPASLAASVATVLAAMLLLVQPGASTRIAGHNAETAQTTERVGSADATQTDRNAPARDAMRRSPSGDRGAVPNEAIDSQPHAATGAEGRTDVASAAGDAGDTPGRAAGAAGAQALPGVALATRWQERARLPGGSTVATATTASEVASVHSDASGSAASIGAADAKERSYEPVLAPALAAYVSAATRESRR